MRAPLVKGASLNQIGTGEDQAENPSARSSCASNKPFEVKGTPYLNPDPFCRFIGPKNWGEALIDDKLMTCLLDNGSQLNFVTPAYAHERGSGHIVFGHPHPGDRRAVASHRRYGR